LKEREKFKPEEWEHTPSAFGVHPSTAKAVRQRGIVKVENYKLKLQLRALLNETLHCVQG